MKLNIDLIYPIGSIYMSVKPTDPSVLFGGTWVSWGSGRVPVGVDSSQTEFDYVEKIGGSKYLQAHRHSVTFRKNGTNAFYQTYPPMTAQGDTFDGYTAGVVNEQGKSMETGDSGNLQPYITCYMWKRTA